MRPSQREHPGSPEPAPTSDGSGYGFIVGILVAVLVIALLVWLLVFNNLGTTDNSTTPDPSGFSLQMPVRLTDPTRSHVLNAPAGAGRSWCHEMSWRGRIGPP